MALRDDSRISQRRREEVKRVAEEMGYVPDPFLSGLAAYRRRHGTSAFQGVIAWVNHWNPPARLRQFAEFDAYWRGAVAAGRQFGYKVEEVLWPGDCPPKRLEQILLARGIRGVLIPPHHEPPDWGDFDWNKFSLIRFGTSVSRPDSNLVTADQFRAVNMAVRRIHEYGYRRIGLVVDGDFNRKLGGSYYGGFCWAQKEVALNPVLPPLLVDSERHRAEPENESQTVNRWLGRHRPDAILVTESYLPQLLKRLGHRVPQDLAVAATSVLDIPVEAGIDQHSESIGRIAVEMLVKQIHINERGEPRDPCRILIESTWQDGKSLPRRSVSTGCQGRRAESAARCVPFVRA